MASGSKSNSVFTDNSIADGPSSGIKKMKIPGKNGDVLMSSYPPDNTHGLSLPNTTGGSFGGSDTNLSHSLKGASAVQK